VTTSSDRHQKRTIKTISLEPDQLDWAAKRARQNVLAGNVLVKYGPQNMGPYQWTELPKVDDHSPFKHQSVAVSMSRKLPNVLSMWLPQDPPLYCRYGACCVLSMWSPWGPTTILIAWRHYSAIAARWHVAKNFATLHECKQKVQKRVINEL